MSTKAAATNDTEAPPYSEIIADALKEISALHKRNIALDAEIRRLQSSTKKRLDRIRANLRHVEAIR